MSTLGLQDLTLQAVVVRLLLATLFGGTLGLERSRKRRAAGFRTYILVCVSSTLVTMTSQYMLAYVGNTDPARLGAQVISGIGFLGAGSIIVTGGGRQIRGLTTAAGLWACACMGLALGIGFYIGGLCMWLLMIMVLTVFNAFEAKYVARTKNMSLYAVFESIHNIASFVSLAEAQGISVENYDTSRSEYGTGIGVFFSLSFKERKSHREVVEMIRTCEGLIFVEER